MPARAMPYNIGVSLAESVDGAAPHRRQKAVPARAEPLARNVTQEEE